jgi:hypothetical protein
MKVFSSNFNKEAFLLPLFARKQCLTKSYGVTGAAWLVHYLLIGTGHIYHLFRLPEDLEQGIHRAVNDTRDTDTVAIVYAIIAALYDKSALLQRWQVGLLGHTGNDFRENYNQILICHPHCWS